MAFIFSRCVSFCCHFVWQMIFHSLHVKCSVYLIIYSIHCHLGHCIWAKCHDCMSHSLKLSEWVKLRIRNKFSVRAIICFYLYLLIRQSYTHGSGLKSAFTVFITTVLWIRPNHPMNRVHVTALRTQHRIQTQTNTRTRPHASAGSLDRTSSLLLHYSCFFIELLRHQCLWLPAGDGWHSARHQWLQVWEWD